MQTQRSIAEEQLAKGEITVAEYDKLIALLDKQEMGGATVSNAPISNTPVSEPQETPNWYYEINESPIGPHSLQEIQRLLKSGAINKDTLVWKDGFEDWCPIEETDLLNRNVATADHGDTVTIPETQSTPAVASAPTPEQKPVPTVPCGKCGYASPESAKFCLECGSLMPASGAAQPVHIAATGAATANPGLAPEQSSSVTTESEYMYAGFWIRFGAYLIDTVIWILIVVAVGLLLFSIDEDLLGFLPIFSYLGAVVYWWLMESSSWQGTFGKKMLGLKIVDLNENRLTGGKAFGRAWGKLLSGLILIGLLMPAWTKRKQALHDMMSGTLVLRPRQ